MSSVAAAASSSTSEMERRQYFARVTDMLIERSTLPARQQSDEDDQLLTKNSLMTFLRDPISLALDYECAKRIELLLQYASAAQLCQVVDAVAHKFVYLAEHHSASHVVQTLLVCIARALLAADDDVAPLVSFLANAVRSMLNSFAQSAANRYAPHVFATLLRLLAGAPLVLGRVELHRPGNVPGAELAAQWHATSSANVDVIRSVVDWLAALDGAAFTRLVNETIHATAVLTALLDITSDPYVRATWGKALWQVLVDKARNVDALVTSAGGSLFFEHILRTCPDEAAFNSLFDLAIKSRLVELATHAHANHVVTTVLKTATDRALVRNIIRSLLPHIDAMLQTVVRRPVRGGNNKKKASFEPISARRPVPLVVDAMCFGAQQHAIVPLQESIVAALKQFSIDSAKQTRFERALHHHFVKNPQVRTDEEFRATYADSEPDVAANGIGGLFRGLLELNQRFISPQQALARTQPPKESLFSINGALILQSVLLFASPHCDAVVQSMIDAPAALLLVLARDKCSYVFDRVFSSATVTPHLKQQLIDQLIVNVVDMATHNVASRVVEAAFAAADIDRKRAIAQALAAQYDVVRATKPGSFVLRNCRVTNTGDVAAEWERKQAKVEHARRMFADIIGSGDKNTNGNAAAVSSTSSRAANDGDDEELFGQPVEPVPKTKKPKERERRPNERANAEQELPPARHAGKKRTSDERVDDDELAKQMAEFDDYEATTKAASTAPRAQGRKWDTSVLAALKPVFATELSAPVAAAEEERTESGATKRKSKPNARSRRRLKRQQDAEDATAGGGDEDD